MRGEGGYGGAPQSLNKISFKFFKWGGGRYRGAPDRAEAEETVIYIENIYLQITAEPQTFSGPRWPPRASAMPMASCSVNNNFLCKQYFPLAAASLHYAHGFLQCKQ